MDKKDYDENDENLIPQIWVDIANDIKALEKYGLDFTRRYIINNMKEDVAELEKAFREDFKDVPNDDPIKQLVMSILSILGITIESKYYDYQGNEISKEEAKDLMRKLNLSVVKDD